MDIARIINVQLLAEGASASTANINDVLLLTTEQGAELSSANRYAQYTSSSPIDSAFGTSSKTASFATSFFATSPNPTTAGGSLIVGYWRAADETVAATAATLAGDQLAEATVVSQLQLITDGSFSLEVDGVELDVINLSFTSISSLDDAVDVINAALTGATMSNTNSYLTITSDTTGATSTIDYMIEASDGTFIGDILGLAGGTGAVTTQGEDQAILEAESMLDALAAIKAKINFYGAATIEPVLDSEVPLIMAWSAANNVLFYETFSKESRYLEKSTDNPIWLNKQASGINFRCMFSKSGNRKYAVTYMARQHTVIFTGSNTANSMNLKTLPITAEEYTDEEVIAAYDVGADIYTSIKETPCNICAYGNDFSDYPYNLMALVDAVKTGNFNLLKLSKTKVPQTIQGIQMIDDDTTKTCRQYVTNGVLAPGTWTSADFFGDYDTFIDAIEKDGFYILSQDLADQAQSERAERIAPTQQIAVKMAGAVHRENVIINVNK